MDVTGELSPVNQLLGPQQLLVHFYLQEDSLLTTWAAKGNIISGGMLAQMATKQRRDEGLDVDIINAQPPKYNL